MAREEKQRKEQQEADREWALKLEEREEQRKHADAEWRLAAGLKEREALAAQQQSLTEANAAMHVQQTQQQQYTALIARLPKFEGKEMPMAFVQALEKQLRDNRIPDDRWLQTLEACLQGKALQSYWTLVEEDDRRDYASAKDSVLRCLGPPVASKLDQVYNARWVREESVAETWEESTQHVRSFCKDGDTAAEIRFKWTMVRVLGRCRKECAEAVWKCKPKNIPETVAAMKEWEHRNGHPAKVWPGRFDGQRRGDHSAPKPVSKLESPPVQWMVVRRRRETSPGCLGV